MIWPRRPAQAAALRLGLHIGKAPLPKKTDSRRQFAIKKHRGSSELQQIERRRLATASLTQVETWLDGQATVY